MVECEKYIIETFITALFWHWFLLRKSIFFAAWFLRPTSKQRVEIFSEREFLFSFFGDFTRYFNFLVKTTIDEDSIM